MNTFYTILSVPIRPEIDEKLSVGLLIVSGNELFYNVSETKLNIVKKLVNANSYKIIQDSLKHISKSIKHEAPIDSKKQLMIINKSDKFNSSYIDYLSRYNNNLLSLSSPKPIEVKASKDLFNKLFLKFVDESGVVPSSVQKEVHLIESFKKEYLPTVKEYFNIEKEISFSDYPGLLMPVKIDLMGKNEIEVFAQTVNMDKNLRSVQLDISDLLLIQKAIPKAKQFLISQEPDKNNVENHNVWNNIRQYKELEYVDISEVEKIKNYAVKHCVKPLFQV